MWLLLYSMVHPHNEFANSVWCSFKQSNITVIQKFQKTATKLVIKLKNKSHRVTCRSFHLNLPTLKYRRLRGDMIDVFKIIHNIYDATVSPHLPFNKRANITGSSYKLLNHTFYYDLWQHFFICTHCKYLE